MTFCAEVCYTTADNTHGKTHQNKVTYLLNSAHENKSKICSII